MPDALSLSPRRIALIKPSALGDIMHALPVLDALRGRFPAAHITWVVNRLYEPLLLEHPDLNATLPFDRQLLRTGWVRGTMGLARFLRLLRGQEFDLVIDLQGLLRTGLMSLATGAKHRLGLASAARERAGFTRTSSTTTPERPTREEPTRERPTRWIVTGGWRKRWAQAGNQNTFVCR